MLWRVVTIGGGKKLNETNVLGLYLYTYYIMFKCYREKRVYMVFWVFLRGGMLHRAATFADSHFPIYPKNAITLQHY